MINHLTVDTEEFSTSYLGVSYLSAGWWCLLLSSGFCAAPEAKASHLSYLVLQKIAGGANQVREGKVRSELFVSCHLMSWQHR